MLIKTNTREVGGDGPPEKECEMRWDGIGNRGGLREEREGARLGIFELFRFSLFKMARNLAAAQKKGVHWADDREVDEGTRSDRAALHIG